MFGGAYKGASVLITGHTGFKGSWAALWLSALGARVTGFSLGVPTEPSNFEASGIRGMVEHIEGDVRDARALDRAMAISRPDLVLHMAAQSLVRPSYETPADTFDANVMGTVRVLDAARAHKCVRGVVVVTSDKCYRNMESDEGYDEDAPLGGADPYSASKSCAEIVTASYVKSFFSSADAPGVASVRAGNVIGGGDWARDRIVPDCVRAWAAGAVPVIRNPHATRPWQFVLEPLSGYLALGSGLLGGRFHGEAFNFGPPQAGRHTVGQLVDDLAARWGASWRHEPDASGKKESALLALSIEKARRMLQWSPALTYDETIEMTARWYRAFYDGGADMKALSMEQIESYAQAASERGIHWAAR